MWLCRKWDRAYEYEVYFDLVFLLHIWWLWDCCQKIHVYLASQQVPSMPYYQISMIVPNISGNSCLQLLYCGSGILILSPIAVWAHLLSNYNRVPNSYPWKIFPDYWLSINISWMLLSCQSRGIVSMSCIWLQFNVFLASPAILENLWGKLCCHEGDYSAYCIQISQSWWQRGDSRSGWTESGRGCQAEGLSWQWRGPALGVYPKHLKTNT